MKLSRTQQIFAFVVFGFFIVFSIAAVMAPRSQQWEYMIVHESRVETGSGMGTWLPSLIRMGDGQFRTTIEIKKEGYLRRDWLNVMGADGWEMVNGESFGEGWDTTYSYNFKRPKR
ncbi:MAG: hypothetical protein VYA84_05225 [Planctomycetota bacterium]|nr:hypothetical protein [Planctomycetota bacterium]